MHVVVSQSAQSDFFTCLLPRLAPGARFGLALLLARLIFFISWLALKICRHIFSQSVVNFPPLVSAVCNCIATCQSNLESIVDSGLNHSWNSIKCKPLKSLTIAFHYIQSPSKIEALVKTLEKEREYYKDECETLQGMLRKRLMETGSPSSKRKGKGKGKVSIYSSRTHLIFYFSSYLHALS